VTAALELRGLHAHRGVSHVLQGVDIVVPIGQVTALLGRNGMGKTTTIETVMGILQASAGRILLFGTEVTSWPSHRRARLGVGLVPQGRHVFQSLTSLETLEVAARPGAMSIPRLVELFPALGQRLGIRAGHLSGGEQQMLVIARALRTAPRLLILDEPSEGLAPHVVRSLMDVIKQLTNEGMAVLLAEQNIQLACELATTAHIIERGRSVYSAPAGELLEDTEIQRTYLGIGTN
jgi:branched-chain amino acid transport system ATP-binding protein